MTSPNDLADRVAEVAHRLENAGVTTDRIEVTPVSVAVQLATEADVDSAAREFVDTEADDHRSGFYYTRVGFLNTTGTEVTVRLYAPRSAVRCGCGEACTHGGAAA